MIFPDKSKMHRIQIAGMRDAELVYKWMIRECIIPPDQIIRNGDTFYVNDRPLIYTYEDGNCVKYVNVP